MPKAYVISEVTFRDEDAAARYREIAARAVAEHGGRYLARGAVPDMIEGDRPGGERLVVIEFPSAERARAWYGSETYAQALAHRDAALERRLTLVEGLPEG
jgi:uncharacterized protein (DUF1330 family)